MFFLLHVFTDALEKAYDAVVYARCVQTNGKITSNIVMSKSRVFPLKSASIPRLEFCGAVLGLNLSKQMANVLEMGLREVTFWTDNMNILYWIRKQSWLFKCFLAN